MAEKTKEPNHAEILFSVLIIAKESIVHDITRIKSQVDESKEEVINEVLNIKLQDLNNAIEVIDYMLNNMQ